MSATPAGDEIHDQPAPGQPPVARSPVTSLVAPGIFVVVVIFGVIFGIIPMFKMLDTADKNLEKLGKNSVSGYVAPTPAMPVPVSVPATYPGGSFSPTNP